MGQHGQHSLAAAIRCALLGAVLTTAGANVAAQQPAPRSGGQAGHATVYTRADLEHSGHRTVADFLQRLPQSGGALGPRYNGGGNGEHRVDLRELGAQRTLVLLDGRRLAPTLDGAADLSRIPLAIVERIEIEHGSAGARRGSNAIAGTINLVTREGLDGAEARVWVGRSDEGDGEEQAYDVAIGARSDRASTMLVASWEQADGILDGDRAISREPLFGLGGNSVNTGASSTTPFGRFGRVGVPGTVTLIPGRPGTSPADFRAFDTATDGFNFVPDNYLMTPTERSALYARTRYAISDDVAFRASLLTGERRSQQRLAPVPFTLGAAFGNTITIAASNVYNPFGVEVTRAQYRNTIVPRTFDQDADTFRAALGFDGGFDAAGRRFDWQLGVSYEDVEERSTTRGLFDEQRIVQGLGPSFIDAASGAPTCGTPSAPIPGCVPIDLFSGPGAFTAEMAEFAGITTVRAQRVEQVLYDAAIAADLFALPAGALRASLSFEHRADRGRVQPPAAVALGTFSEPGLDGDNSGDDTALAIDVPLLRAAPLAHALDLSLAVRHARREQDATTPIPSIRHDLFGVPIAPGRDWDETLPALSLTWTVTPAFSVRADAAEGLREPSLFETGTAAFTALGNEIDPCADSSDPTGIVLARCRDGFGGIAPVSPGYDSNNVQHAYRSGGNPDLLPERSRSHALTFVLRPDTLPGFGASLSWWRIRVRDRIGAGDVDEVLARCYVSGDLDACALIERPGDGTPDVFVGSQNLPGELDTRGVDVALDYAFDLGGGKLALDARATWLDEFRGGESFRCDGSAGDSPACGDVAGVYLGRGSAFNRLRARFTADWIRGDWGATLVARHLSSLEDDCSLAVAFGAPERCSDPDGSDRFRSGATRQGARTYLDLQGRWQAPWNAQLTAGVRNLLNEEPPVSYSTFSGNFDPQYELPGRFFYVGYAQRF